MKRHLRVNIILATIVTILFGCGSGKKAVYSDENIVREDSTWKNLSYLHGTRLKLTDLVCTDIGVKLKYIKYNTDKPKDKLTGLPPVEEEGEVELDFNQNRKKGADVADSTHVKSDEGGFSKEERETDNKEIVEYEETNFLKDLKSIVVGFISLIVITIVIKKCK